METAHSSDRIYQVAIVGAGPAGATLAIICAAAGLDTVLLDARPVQAGDRSSDTRNFAIVRGSWRLLTAAGVTDALSDVAQPLEGLEATDGAHHWLGAPSALFGTADLGPDPDDTPLGQMVEAAALQAALDRRLADLPDLDWRRDTRFATLAAEAGHATLTLEDGHRVRADIVVGCDGVASPVRQALGIETDGRDYGKSVLAANVSLSVPHRGIARQLFTPEGPFATLPLRGDRANLAWYMKRGAAEALAERPPEAIEAELNARFARFAGEMALDGPVLTYPLRLQVARALTGPRAALVGDAVRRINPLAGQGLNLGFKDVAALAEVLVDAARNGLPLGADTTLSRYVSWRKFDSTLTALGMDLVDRTFSNDNPLLKPLRGLALAAADRLAPVRATLARQASADQSWLPKLMRGEAL